MAKGRVPKPPGLMSYLHFFFLMEPGALKASGLTFAGKFLSKAECELRLWSSRACAFRRIFPIFFPCFMYRISVKRSMHRLPAFNPFGMFPFHASNKGTGLK